MTQQPIETIDLCDSDYDNDINVQNHSTNRSTSLVMPSTTSVELPQLDLSTLVAPIISNVGPNTASINRGSGDNTGSSGEILVQITTIPNALNQATEPVYSVLTPRTLNSTEIDTSNLFSAALSLEFDPDQFESAFADFDFDLLQNSERQN